MRSKTFMKCVVLQGVIAALCVGTARADGKWYDAVTASGYLQTSYTGNLNKPTDGSGAKVDTVGRAFDTDSNGFNMNTFLLQLAKPVGDDKYGFTTRFRTGQDASVISGGNSSFAVQEAYLTYATTAKLSFIGGKFNTPLGYEVVDSVSNPQFSEGLLFTFAEPINHTGLKANYVFGERLNATIGLVNGWDVADPDNNSAKTLLWQVATTPLKRLSWYFQGLYGQEFADSDSDQGHSERVTFDTVATFSLTDRISLAGQAIWGEESDDLTVTGDTSTTHWSGLGLWGSFAWNAKHVTSARFEVLEDNNESNLFNNGAFTNGSSNQTVKDITLTHKHMLTPSMGVRAEYRHDWSTEAYYIRDDGSNVRTQNTVSADWFVTF